MNIEKKIRLQLWLVGISLFLSVLSVVFSIVHIEPFTVSEATYIGVIVTTMGIIFALFVGYQIYNAIEVKKELQEFVTQKRTLEITIAELADSQQIAEAYNFSNRALFAISINQYDEAIVLFLKSLKKFLISNNLILYMSDIEGITGNIDHCIYKIKKNGTPYGEREINLLAEIRNIPNYAHLNENIKTKLNTIEA